MRISIKNVRARTKHGYVVDFRSGVGSASGLWVADEAPRIDHSYEVELMPSEDLRFGDNVIGIGPYRDFIRTDGNTTVLIGTVHSLSGNRPTVELRIGEETLMLPIYNNVHMDEGAQVAIYTGLLLITLAS